MRETLDVGEPQFELGQDLQYAGGLVFGSQPFGYLAGVRVRASHKSNRLRGEHRRPPATIVKPRGREILDPEASEQPQELGRGNVRTADRLRGILRTTRGQPCAMTYDFSALRRDFE